MALQKDLLSVLAKWTAARGKPNMPCLDVSETLLKIVYNYFISWSKEKGGDWEEEKFVIVKQLESTGILGQYFRCVTQLHDDKDLRFEKYLKILDLVMHCIALMSKQLSDTAPTGVILHDILVGEDGHKGHRNEAVVARLRSIGNFASLSNEKRMTIGGCSILSCQGCGKASVTADFQNSLLRCRYVNNVVALMMWQGHCLCSP